MRPEKEQKRAAALRENLMKRKAQKKAVAKEGAHSSTDEKENESTP